MAYRTISLLSLMTATALVTACDQRKADDFAQERKESQEDMARIQREADQKLAEARRDAEEKTAEARREAEEKLAEASAEANKAKADVHQEVAEERRELQETIKKARKNTKDEYLEYARNRARLLELQAAELKDHAANVPPAARGDIDKTLQEIDAGRRSVLTSLNDFGKDTKEAWGSAKAKIDKELNDLEKRVETIDPVNPKTTTPGK